MKNVLERAAENNSAFKMMSFQAKQRKSNEKDSNFVRTHLH